jgi:maltose alpha-D-glucosyltransferase/alpha-amylase
MRRSRARLAKPFTGHDLVAEPDGLPGFTVATQWSSVLAPGDRMPLETVLVQWMRDQRWFGGKAKTVTHAALKASLLMPLGAATALFNIVEVSYLQGEPELYALPLAFAQGAQAAALRNDAPRFVICDLTVEATGQSGVLHDAAASRDFCKALAGSISTQHRIQSSEGELQGWHTPVFARVLAGAALPEPTPAKAEQSNSSIIYGDKFILKLLRRLYAGINPDLEITEFLTAREFPHSQQLAGALEFHGPGGEQMTLGMLNRFVPGAKDAWAYTLDELAGYYERAGALVAEGGPPPTAGPADQISPKLLAAEAQVLGSYLGSARLLGERTAGLHLALASEPDDEAFAPEPFTPQYVRGLCDSMCAQAQQNLGLLLEHLTELPPDVLTLARRVLELEPAINDRFRLLCERGITACRIRCHGDFVIIDFEGEAAVPPNQRRIKRSPLRDVAGMVRSFDYAAWEGLEEHVRRGNLPADRRRKLEPWLREWHQAASSVYLRAYFQTMGQSEVLPRSKEQLSAMLPAFLLNKAVYELGYELNNRPAWLNIPLHGILLLMEGA